MIQFDRFQLANGLKVLVHQDTTTPMAVVNILYNVGAKDENPAKTGFAHLFEHLMFGGSENIPSFDTPLQKVGGENNAFTTPDLTNYYISVPAQNIETAFWLESDRMKQLAFNTQSLETQRKVVIEEFKQRYLNQPYGDVWLKFRPLIYQKHPYRWPTIGAGIQHIEQAQMSDVKAFFQKHYVPSNAILVVAGRVKVDQVKALAEKWFAPIPAGVKPTRNLPQEPVQTENRSMEMEADVPANRIYKAYPVLGRYEPGYHAIDLMSDLLGRGESSYLYAQLVQKQRLFDTIGTYQTSSIDPGLLIIQGQVSDDVNIEVAEEALEKAIRDFATTKIEEKDLQMVKNQSEASLVFGEVEVLNRAMNLAMAANAGEANLVNTEAEKIAEVQTQDLEKWAHRLFIQGKSNTLKYKKLAK